MNETILTYQCGKQINEVGLTCENDTTLLDELEDETTRFISLSLIDGKNFIISKDVIISIIYRD